MYDPSLIAFGEAALADASRSNVTAPISPEGGHGSSGSWLGDTGDLLLGLGSLWVGAEVQKDIWRDQAEIARIQNEISGDQNRANPSANIQAPQQSFLKTYQTPLVLTGVAIAGLLTARKLGWI